MTLYLSNLAAYSLQLAMLVGAAFVVTALLRMRAPIPALRFWQAVLAASLLLPLLQPWPDGRSDVLASSVVFVSGTAPATALATRGIDWVQALLAVIAGGAIARLLWLGIGILRLRAIVANATPDDALASLTRELSTATGSRATLLMSDDIESPATVGIKRPLILVPGRMREMPQPVQRAVIAHELVHVRRRDWLHTLAEEIWCALLWFHPAARVVSARLSLARETVVDEQTILLTRDRRAYAEALLAFADPQPYLVGMTPLIGRRHLSQRISLIAEEGSMSCRRTLSSVVVAFVISAAATLFAVSSFPLAASLAAQAGQVHDPGPGVTLPSVVREVKPVYTAAAMQKKIQGSVWLGIVVGESGDVTEVKVTRSLDPEYGLNDQAVKAAWGWKFKPGMKDGKPVAVRVTLELTFTLKK